MAVRPDAALSRSFLYRRLDALGAQFEPSGKGTAADRIPDGAAADLTRLGVVDLSPLPRTGFKGRGTMAAMGAAGLGLEDAPNRAFRQSDGSLCAVLAHTEVLILAALGSDGALVHRLESGWSLDAATGTYLLPRSSTHAWFRITGEHAPAMFARLCAIDLRPQTFPDLSIAQTSVAKLTGIIIREDIAGALAFHLLVDSASAEYVWTCLIDAMEEFGGKPAGLAALAELASPHERNRTETAD